LDDASLARPGANRIGDVVGCPGADTCNLAVTRSRRLAFVLSETFAAKPEFGLADDLASVHIKVSGCPNACGQHHVATLGLYGGARRLRGRLVPHYRLLLGGKVGKGTVRFGRPIADIPAKRVPDAILKILGIYRARRRDGESFDEWLEREGGGPSNPVPGLPDGGEVVEMAHAEGEEKDIVGLLKESLAEFQDLPGYEEAPDLYRDWGEEGDFRLKTGRGECAGP